jgi:hypothetical protein
MTDIMERNKSFLLHMNQQSSTIGIYNKKEDDVVTPLVQYTNEFALKIPPQPSFLDTYEPNNEELDVLIQQKLNERDIELMEIQKLYNPDDKIESVKLIKISEVLADLNIFNDDEDVQLPKENNKHRVSIGNTVVYNYQENEPPKQIKIQPTANYDTKNEQILTILNVIVEKINDMDNKMSSLDKYIKRF